MTRIACLVALVLFGGCTSAPGPEEDTLVSRIRDDLPPGWQCTVITQSGEVEHPAGLQQPVMRLDLTSPGQSFQYVRRGRGIKWSPLIQLFLYDIADKPHVREVIEEYWLRSVNIPLYFGETEEYIIVTSPVYLDPDAPPEEAETYRIITGLNHAFLTEEAKEAIRPVWRVLRKHIRYEADRTVDQLVQPDEE